MRQRDFEQFVYVTLRDRPTWLPGTISSATAGVNAFAEKQRDEAGELRGMLCSILDSIPPRKEFGRNLPAAKVIDTIRNWFPKVYIQELEEKFK